VEKGDYFPGTYQYYSSCDLWKFVCLCDQHHMKPIAGVEVRNEDTFCIYCSKQFERPSVHSRISIQAAVAKKPFPAFREKPCLFNDLSDGFAIYRFGLRPLQDLKENDDWHPLMEYKGKNIHQRYRIGINDTIITADWFWSFIVCCGYCRSMLWYWLGYVRRE